MTYLFRPYNDLHNTHGVYQIPVMDNESEMVLSLAGDIYERKLLMPWVHTLSSRFKHIILVLGNHDYWGGSIELVHKSIYDYIALHNLTNVHFLNNSFVELDGIVFYGGTMWTDYNKQDPLTKISTGSFQDYRQIRYQHYMKKFNVNYALGQHIEFKNKLKQLLDSDVVNGRDVVVVSHHAPCALSIVDEYKGEKHYVHNGFYHSDLSELILDYPIIKLWHHGHTHKRLDYRIGDAARVICNPRGYAPDLLIKQFDHELVIDLSQ